MCYVLLVVLLWISALIRSTKARHNNDKGTNKDNNEYNNNETASNA